MSITIKQLAAGVLVADAAAADMSPAVPTGKAWIIESMRFFNKSSSASMALTVFLSSPNVSPFTGTADKIIAKVSIPPNASFIANEQLTLEYSAGGTKLKYTTGAVATADFVVSGIERDA